ncbi:MHO_4530 family protein [Metamycoplasma canadense]|nr:hypothetical protein [Metamycoplasma canadense]
MNKILEQLEQPKIYNKNNYSWLVISVVLFVLIICILTTLLIIFIKKRSILIDNKNGFLNLEVDLEKERIKRLSNINETANEPFFLRKLNFLNNKWKKLSDFQNLLDKNTNIAFISSLKKKENTIINFEKDLNKWFLTLKIKASIEIKIVDKKRAYLTLNWSEYNKKEDFVFEQTNMNTNYLLNENSNYLVCGFILNIKNIYNINNFLNLFKKDCVKNKIEGIKVFLDWNKLFFVFPLSKFKRKQAEKNIRIINETSFFYKHLFNLFFAFDSSLLTKKEYYNYEIIFDYLKNDYKQNEDYWISNDITNSEDFKQFQEKYDYVLNEINNSNSIELKNIPINSFAEDKSKLTLLLNELKFEALNIENTEILSTLDIYKNYFIKLYDNINPIDFHGKILVINDFIFDLMDNKKIENLMSINNSLLQLVVLNTKKSLKKVKKKIEIIQENKIKGTIGIKISEINDDIISTIDKWVKIIWISKSITNNLNNPQTMFYVRLLLERAEQFKILIIFENLDYKNYKKVLYNNNNNLFYTKNKSVNK